MVIFTVEAVSGLFMLFASSFYHLAIIQCLAGFCSIGLPICSLLVADISTYAERGFANAAIHLSGSLGSLAQIVAVPIIETWGILSVFPFASIFPVTTLLVVNKYIEPLSTEEKKEKKRERNEEIGKELNHAGSLREQGDKYCDRS